MFIWSLQKTSPTFKIIFMLFTVSKTLNTNCGTVLIMNECQQKWKYILSIEAILEYLYLLIVCACACMRGTFVPRQRATLWHQFSPSTLRVPGIKLRSTNLQAKCLYPLSQLTDFSFRILWAILEWTCGTLRYKRLTINSKEK